MFIQNNFLMTKENTSVVRYPIPFLTKEITGVVIPGYY